MLIEAETQFAQGGRSRGFPGGHGNIDRRQGVLVQAKGFSCETFDAIASYCRNEGSRRDAQAQSRVAFMVGQNR